MWQNNGYVNNGNFPNSFNQDDFPTSPFTGSTGVPGQQYFPPHPHPPNMMQFDNGNVEGYMSNEFQPEVGLYNERAFSQNQFASPHPQYSPSQFALPQATVPTPLVRPTISNRAAELRAQLLKGREGRANSSTPPVTTSGQVSKQAGPPDSSSSLRNSPKTPVDNTAEDNEQELNINELISQYSDSKPTSDSIMDQEKKAIDQQATTAQRPQSIPNPLAKSQILSLGSPTKLAKPATNGSLTVNTVKVKNTGSRHASNGSMSEISEGEILEEPSPPKKVVLPLQPTQPPRTRESQLDNQKISTDVQPTRKPRDEPRPKLENSRALRAESPARRPPHNDSKAQPSRSRDDWREETESRLERRPSYPSDYNAERRPYSGSDNQPNPRRDQIENYRRPEIKNDQKREEISRSAPLPIREPEPPTLAQFLAQDEDLREWLEITGYHNETYRNKILNRRRAIAALDAQRSRLLAEMEAEERGGIPIVGGVPASSTIMLPPPLPNKAGVRPEAAQKPEIATAEPQHDRVVSNKRAYSDIQDPRDEASIGKMQRTEDRGPRVKREEDLEQRRPRSSGYDTPRRGSFDRREDRANSRPRYDESHARGRGNSRERELSPGLRAYENRPPARDRGYENDYYERDDRADRRDTDKRPYEVRGGYRGRAYDPNYRGRGRGARGRGDFQSHLDSRADTSSFGSRIANGPPLKDHRGFQRGGKGETRYFIVKSFNEDNVLRCIEDGIWTTQAQNGPVFKEAFETCKNVILVFSINKSKAFQGYARMESLPGTVEVPAWQKQIAWESTGAFKVRWLVVCATRFQRIGHLKNKYNENQAVLIGKDGQEIEENCGAGLIELIDEEVDQAIASEDRRERESWED